MPMCVRVAGVVFRTFCYFKYRNRFESSEKGINSSHATRDMYRWVKKRVLMQSEPVACQKKSFCSPHSESDYYCLEAKKYKVGRR